MSRRAIALAALLAACAVSAAARAPQDAGATLHVAHRAAPLAPGDVVWVSARASMPLRSVTGTAFGRSVRFWPADRPGTWEAFVPIGVETAPGSHEITIRAAGLDSLTLVRHIRIDVLPRRFETRRLRVANGFVEPPPDEARRIAQDAQAVAAIYSRTDTERLWRGPFSLPVPGEPTSSFGRLSVYNGQPRGRHQGTDFAAATGTPVRAPNAGRIVLARDLYLSGGTIILDHGAGLFSVFAHLSRMAVGEGALVTRGEILADAGATGRVTGPHLHWAVRLGEVTVDPLSLVAAVADLPAEIETVETSAAR